MKFPVEILSCNSGLLIIENRHFNFISSFYLSNREVKIENFMKVFEAINWNSMHDKKDYIKGCFNAIQPLKLNE